MATARLNCACAAALILYAVLKLVLSWWTDRRGLRAEPPPPTFFERAVSASWVAPLRALPTLAADPERLVAGAPMDLLRFSREYLLAESERPALDRYARKLYEARLRKLGYAEKPREDGDVKLLRADLAWFFAHGLRDPAVRTKLQELGDRYLGLGGRTPDPLAVSMEAGITSTMR